MADTGLMDGIGALNARTASFGRRFVGQLVDAILITVASVVVALALHSGGGDRVISNVAVWVLAALYYM